MNPNSTQFSKETLVMQRAQKAVLARDYQAAIRLYVRILKEDPNNKEVLTNLGGVYVSAGDDANALKIFTTILKNDPSNFKILNSVSGIYRRMGKLDESLEVIKKLKDSGLNKDEVEFNAGYTYKLMGKYDEAISSFYNALEKNPGDVLAYNHIGSIEDLRGNKDKALAAFSRGLQIDPNNPVLHYNTAMHFASQNEPDKAAQHFESALKAKAGWGDALNQYSDLLIKQGTEERAEKLLLKNVTLNPENTTAYNKLGKLYARQEKYDAAEQMYLKVLDFDSENMTALSGLGTVYDKQKKYFDAAAILERLGKLQADDTATALRYAKILIELKRLQDAAILLKKLYIKQPDNISLLNILAQYFVRSKDFKKAYVCFKRISGIDPNECDFLKENAAQFMYVKAFVNAEKLLQSYVKKRPDDSEAWASLAHCYEAMGLYEESLCALQRCLELDKNNFSAIELLGNLSRLLSHNPKSMSIITELLNKNISAEGNLDTLLNSMQARENIFNHITKSHNEDESDSLPVEDENIGAVEPHTEIDLFDEGGANDENELMQLDFFPPDEITHDEYSPFDLIGTEEGDSERIHSDESFNFSDLLAPDMPVEYDRSRDGDLTDTFFDFPYSQRYDPAEEESVIDVAGTGFEPEDFDEGEGQSEPAPDAVQTSAPFSYAADKPEQAPPLLPKSALPFEPLASEPEPFFEKESEPINVPPAEQEIPAENIELPLEEVEELKESEMLEAPEENTEESAEEEIIQDDKNDLTLDEELMRQTREVLAHVFEKPPIKEFSRTFEMFNSLRGLCSYLPALKKDEFFSDLNRVKLDYVIDRVQGKAGLLAAAEALHTRGFIKPKEESGRLKAP